MKNQLKDHLAILLLEEVPFPPHPGSRVSTHQQTQNKEVVEHPKRLGLAG
jgi:hypothetical protein